ncbi:vgr related protein [Altericroceibacterium endophyticum]|uniref:Vgr related protein n=1 Tax=Altericroceibacterium endophyticum TaxID=1808508 RepID=A0A6I4T2U5_9SPHN|nr:vgr related protein [Altericroceibacterium endophyticum]MXO64479.1 vgr related protein [Altericroceibacterium endophyticum]
MHDAAKALCPPGGERRLTHGETALARTVFGNAIEYGNVRIVRRKWFPFQPRGTVMAPRGAIHFHPRGPFYCDDFAEASLTHQGLFIHEMTHVWQTTQRGEYYLVLHRHPFCSYDYSLKPGWKLERYGIEQQAEIVRHAFLLRNGLKLAGVSDGAAYDLLVNFPGAQ